MRFSIVIPTHNRLNLLRDAVETVRRQSKSNWELAIFDNGSTEPIEEFVRDLDDDRIRFERSNEFLPVTDSWNRAVALARGDYVILVGDDDGLAPAYFEKIEAIVAKYDGPELVYSAIYQFFHPGVAPWEPKGYVSDIKNGFFFAGRNEPFCLKSEDARAAVVGSLHFRRNFTFNIQAFCFRRDFLIRLGKDGGIFRSPFPDYYLANVAMAHAKSIVIVPEPLAIAGVSRASYGFTLFNNLDVQGEALLNTKLGEDPVYREIQDQLLPGSMYQTNYAVTMEYVARAIRPLINERVDFRRYRRIQILSVLDAGMPKDSHEAWNGLMARLSPLERLWAIYARTLKIGGAYVRPLRKLQRRLERAASATAFKPIQQILNFGVLERTTDLYTKLEEQELR